MSGNIGLYTNSGMRNAKVSRKSKIEMDDFIPFYRGEKVFPLCKDMIYSGLYTLEDVINLVTSFYGNIGGKSLNETCIFSEIIIIVRVYFQK